MIHDEPFPRDLSIDRLTRVQEEYEIAIALFSFAAWN